MARPLPHIGPLIAGGALIGVGMGGFVDGILFHQILQWHHMLSTPLPPTDLINVKVNMFWDGLFHAFTWIVTLIGVVLLWRAGKRTDVPWSTRTFAGSLALGWGLFNLVEGLIDHQALGIHHVHPGAGQIAWDVGFLVFGGALIVGGCAAIKWGRADTTSRGGVRVAAPSQPS